MHWSQNYITIPEFQQKFQLQQLKNCLKYTNLHSAFYQNYFKTNDINILDFKSLQDFNKIPITTKNQLQKYPESFLAVPKNDIIEISSTSGSTGQPLFFKYNAQDLERVMYNETSSLALANVTQNDIVVIMTTLDKRFIAGLAYYLALNNIGSKVIRCGVGALEMQWETILNLKATAIIAVPSFILKLIEYAKQQGIHLNNTSVKKAICIGESILDEHLKPNALHQFITNQWSIELFSTYASTEMSTAFTECIAHQGLHVQPHLIYAEVLDEHNNPLPPGKVGELTVTPFRVETMPLIRFKTGDIVYYTDTVCACGRIGRRISPVLGRTQNRLKLKGTTIYPEAIIKILYQCSQIDNFAIVAELNLDQTDHISIYYSTKQHTELQIDTLKNMLQSSLRVLPKIYYETSTFVDNLLQKFATRKVNKFIDLRPKSI